MNDKVIGSIAPVVPTRAETPAERAAYTALMTVADFYIAIQEAQTVDEALRIRELIAQVLASVDAVESAALERADKLCDGPLCFISAADYRKHFQRGNES